MLSFPLLKTTACALVLSISLWTCGCVAAKYVVTDSIGECQDKPVKILTPGGSEYHFRTWSVTDSCIVTSEGEVHHPSMKPGFWGTRFDSFSGAVPLDSIGQCFCEKTDVLGTVAGNLLLLVVVAPILLAAFFWR